MTIFVQSEGADKKESQVSGVRKFTNQSIRIDKKSYLRLEVTRNKIINLDLLLMSQ